MGRTSFKLAHEFDEVIGVDLSARFIQCATDLKEKENLDYQTITEGELVTSLNANLSKLGVSEQNTMLLSIKKMPVMLNHDIKTTIQFLLVIYWIAYKIQNSS